jgi:hypothetical protein
MTDMGIDWICWTVYYACMEKKGNIRHIAMKTRYPDAMQVALTSLYILFTTSRMMAAMKNKIVLVVSLLEHVSIQSQTKRWANGNCI